MTSFKFFGICLGDKLGRPNFEGWSLCFGPGWSGEKILRLELGSYSSSFNLNQWRHQAFWGEGWLVATASSFPPKKSLLTHFRSVIIFQFFGLKLCLQNSRPNIFFSKIFFKLNFWPRIFSRGFFFSRISCPFSPHQSIKSNDVTDYSFCLGIPFFEISSI